MDKIPKYHTPMPEPVRQDRMTITTSRFEELIQAEAELGVIRRAYEQGKSSLDVEYAAAFVFGSKENKDESGDGHA